MKRKKNKRHAASMAMGEIVCICNAVSKETILDAVREKGLTTVEQVKKCTKASDSCGSCKQLVSEILSYTTSESFNGAKQRNPICSCTNFTEDEVIKEIQERNLLSVPEVMAELDWKLQDGCSVCQGAIHYYLGMLYPDYRSITDEPIYGSSQIDGTYSIIPQMYGGITNAEQLTKIVNVVEKYQIPYVTLTSGQKIQLMGIKKDILFHVCKDLNMPLRPLHVYTIQSVTSDIGSHICQCGKLPSLHLAAELERQLEFLAPPQYITMSVSSCIHNGKEVITKDIGIIGIDRGWEIHVGGSSTPNLRTGEILFVAETSEEALESVLAFIQYYRESAGFLECTGKWIDRIGLIHIREVLFDIGLREQLLKRLKQEADKHKKLAKDYLFNS